MSNPAKSPPTPDQLCKAARLLLLIAGIDWPTSQADAEQLNAWLAEQRAAMQARTVELPF